MVKTVERIRHNHKQARFVQPNSISLQTLAADTQKTSFLKPVIVVQPNTISSIPSLKYQSIKEVSKRFFHTRAVKRLFGISESTQFRYEKQNLVLKSAIADRLERFNRICQQALELFEDETETQRWLSTPKVTLGGQTPLNALSTDAGAKKVEQILYQAEYGMFG